MTAQLTLKPESSAAGIARRWVRTELAQRSRPELLESAILGVSELVTNALLHVRSPINVRIVDVDARVRIEVYDDSTRPPDGRPAFMVSRGTNPSTFGRGLQIVDSISLSWGVAYEDAGKCVWFQPTPDGCSTPGREALPHDQSTPDVTNSAAGQTFSVELLDVPVVLLMHYRVRFRDLRRELTLIALDNEEHATVPGQLNEVARQLEVYKGATMTAEAAVDKAVAAGRDRTTLRYTLPLAAVPGISDLQRLVLEADEFCRARRLLTLAAGPQENALRAWYLGEFAAQAGRARPTPWPGAFVVTDPEPLH